MDWNYRIVEIGRTGYALYEVHYDEQGNPSGWTSDPLCFSADAEEGPEGIIRALEQALRDAKQLSTLKLVDGKLVGEPAFSSWPQTSGSTQSERVKSRWQINPSFFRQFFL